MKPLLDRLIDHEEIPDIKIRDAYHKGMFDVLVAGVESVVAVETGHIFIMTAFDDFRSVLQFKVEDCAGTAETLEKVASMDFNEILERSNIAGEFSRDHVRGYLFNLLRPDLVPGQDEEAAPFDAWSRIVQFVNRTTRGQRGESPVWDSEQMFGMITDQKPKLLSNGREDVINLLSLDTPEKFRNFMAAFYPDIDAPIAEMHSYPEEHLGNAILLKAICPALQNHLENHPAEDPMLGA